MAVVEVTTGVTLEQYLAIKERVEERNGPVAGRLAQVCYGDGEDLRIVTVYESEAACDAFTEGVLAKALADLEYGDIRYESQVLPVHDVTT
jgi:hypothetical protein